MKRKGTWSFRNLALAVALPLLATSAAACGDDDGDNNNNTMAQAELRVIHLSPDAPAVDVWANGTTDAVQNLAFGSGTDYLSLDVGTYDFSVAPAGTSAADSVLDVDGVALAADQKYTVVAFDELSGIQALLLEDDESSLGAGDIRVRAIHTAVGVGEVDIWNIPDMGDPAPLYENVGFGVAGAYMDLPAGAYTLGIDVDDDATPDLVFELPSLPAGTVANVFAVASGGSVYLLAQLQDGSVDRIDASTPTTRIRVLHMSRDAGAVDVWAGTELKAVDNLAFPDGTEYLTLDAGTYTFNVTAMGGDPAMPVLSIADIALEEDKSYTAVAYDDVGMIKAMALEDDYSAVGAGNIRVRAIHTAPGVGTVDIWNITDPVNPSPLYTAVAFGDAGAYAEIPAGAYTLGFDVNDDGTPDVAFQTPDLAEGTIVSLFAAQDTNDDIFLLAQFADGTTARIDATPPPAYLRVLHLSRDTPAVDVWAGTTVQAVTGLAFPDGTPGFLSLAADTYDFNIVAAGGDPASPALAISGLALDSNTFYTAVAFDDFSNITALPLVEDFDDVASTDIRVRAIHTAVGVGVVDIWNVTDPGNPSPLYTTVNFGDVAAYADLPADAYSLGIDATGDGTPEFTYDLPALPGGTVANIFAVSDTDNSVFLLAQFKDGSTARINAN